MEIKKKYMVVGIIFAIVFLYIAWYLLSPLFITKEVNEEIPVGNQQENTELLSTVYTGSFVGADSFHNVEGKAKIISDNNKVYLRLEDFKSTNGPDLKVYLSEDLNAKSYVSLGELKGNIGNQNYEITEEVDFNKYNQVLIWCEQFSVLFGNAELEGLSK